MDQTTIKQKVDDILANNKIGTLATVRNNKPFSRYMTFFHDELHLYTATNKDTHKVEDLQKNDDVHILLGFDEEGIHDTYVEIEGKATIKDSNEIKHMIWSDDLEPWFEGPDDPDYTVLEIDPTVVRLMNTDDGEPHVLEF